MTTNRPVALVTGGATGIGKTAAAALVQAGFEVIGTSRTTTQLAPVKGVTFLDLDVTSDDSVTAAVGQVIQRFGRIDVLVNNAGIGSAGAAEENSITAAQTVFDINVFGVIRMTNAVLPHMRAQGSGRIINISSLLGLIPQPYMAIYVASKHAVEGYSESVDHEVREYDVRALLVEPAYTNTAFEANSVRADMPLQVYAKQREVFEQYMVDQIKGGDDPALVAKAIVAASTDSKPKMRYPVGMAGRVSIMRRLVPSRIFDRQVRKLNRLPV